MTTKEEALRQSLADVLELLIYVPNYGQAKVAKARELLSTQPEQPVAQEGELRISMSGYSLKTGWGDEKRIVAICPGSSLTSHPTEEQFKQWQIDAARLCDGWNAAHPIEPNQQAAGAQDKDAERYPAIWLEGFGGHWTVKVEIDGRWIEVIKEFDGGGHASHIVEPLGIQMAIDRALRSKEKP